MDETLASLRRPKRGRPPRPREDHLAAEYFVEEEEEEDAEAEALARPQTKRKRAASAAATAALEDQTLIDIIKHNGRLISRAVKKLVEDYESNPKSVMFQILAMLFEACGARHNFYADYLYEADVDGVVFSLVELAKKGMVEDNYNTKQKDLKNFKENLVSFWDTLVHECQNGPLFDGSLFQKIKDYVVALSCTPPRVYRQVASLVGLQLVTSLISVAKTLSGQRETTQRQLNAEKKKQTDGPIVESLNKRLAHTHKSITYLEELMRKIFSGLFMHRYRDVDPEIRMSCIKSLGIWVVSYPSLFLQDIYLKYLGWTLNDKNAGVRRTSILALQSLYEVDENIPSLGLFTERFYSRMIQLADDVDISVAVSAIGLIKQLLRHQLLSDDDLGPLYDLLIDEPPLIRRAIGELVYDHLIAQNIKTSQSGARDGNNDSSEVHIGRMLQILREFSDDPVLSSYVIDDIWDDMKAMKDWKCIISMLLDENPLTELTDMDGTNLVRMLRASAKKAVGERIVPATDNRKLYYNKGQKEILENSKHEITTALLKKYPQLLRKYISDKTKISPLIDMMMLMKLELYSLKRQDQHFKAAIDLIADAFFKHGDKETLRSCIKAITFCCTNCQADLQNYAENKLKDLEDELVLKVKTAIKEVEAGDDEYSLMVNLKRFYELQLSKPVKNDGLFEDMYRILSHLKDMDNEVKSFLLLNMYLQLAWCLNAIDGENPSEASIDELLSRQSSLFEKLYYYLVVLPTYQKEGRSTTILSCRVCVITAEMWCLFKKPKYSSTRLDSLGYLPQLDVVQNFWKLCEQQLNIPDEIEDEDANEEYIEDTNKDVVMIAAAKLVLADTVSKDYLGPEIVSHYASHGTSTTEIIKHLITSLRKNADNNMSALFFEALKRAYERYMAHVNDGENQTLIGKSYSECQDLAGRLAGSYVGASRNKNKSEILKIIQDGVSFAFVDLPKQLSFLEAALLPFVSKLPSSDIPDILIDVQKRTQDTNTNEDPSAWRPYFTFVEHLRDKHAKNEVLQEEKEEKPVKRRGRPRKVRDVPARNLFDGHKSSDEESVSDSDQGHGEDNDDDDADQPLINTFRSSASKLRSLKVSQQGTSGQKGSSRASVQMIDMVSVIEELSGLTSRELGEMLKESENFVLQAKTEDGGTKQVDMEKLVSSLPLHLLAVCLELERGSDLAYVLRGMRFLHSLSELAARHTRLEQVLLDDVKLSEQVMDLIFFVLSILSHWKKENHLGVSPFIHSSLVAASLHLLTSYFSSQWHELVHILLAHPKVDIFMDVAFDSLHDDVRSLSHRLSTLSTNTFPVGPFDSRLTHFICQQCEASLQFLLLLCQQKLFRDRILKNKELSRNGGILSLSRSILKLGVPECLKGSIDIAASVSRLKAKILSILLQLCEAETVSYLDEVATSPKSMQLGQTLALEVLDLLKTAFGRKQKLTSGSHDKSYPMGSVLISALRLVDVFSDDSNFRSSFITNTIPFLTQILAIPHDEFVSNWCSVNLPVIEEDANLDYDPFGAAELALAAAGNKLTEAKANYSCPFRPISMPSIAYAQTRTSCVVKIIANLHVFVPNICEEQERDLFLQKFQKYLVSGNPRSSVHHSASDDLKATTVCRNLGSLSEYARSLIPNNLLNEEDVQLLSEFAYKLQTWCKSHSGQSTSQAVKIDPSSESKEDLKPVPQPLIPSAAAPDSSINNLPKNMEEPTPTNMEEPAPTPSTKQDGNARDETPRSTVALNGGFLQNSVGQDLVHLGVARTSSGFLGGGTSTSTGPLLCKMDLDPASSSMDHFKTPDRKESGLQDDEKGDTHMYDERQPKRRKRTIMNDRQINEIEKALIDEPEMHKNAALLQAWSEKLSGQGSEITSSQLKNWLNNRKAKLARIAKERGVLSEGENADKPSTPATPHLCDSSESAGEESYLPPARVMSALGISKGSRFVSPDGNETTSQAEFNQNIMLSRPFTRSFSFEPGRLVSLIDNDGKEVGRGKIFQVEGRLQGKGLTDTRVCIVDVIELKIEKWRELPHPSEASGRTFQEAESRNGGVMRVAWDVIRLSPVVQ